MKITELKRSVLHWSDKIVAGLTDEQVINDSHSSQIYIQKENYPKAYNLSLKQRQFLLALLDFLELAKHHTPEEIQHSVHDLSKRKGLQIHFAFQAIYTALLGRYSGPRAGALITAMERRFVLKRFRSAARITEAPNLSNRPVLDIENTDCIREEIAMFNIDPAVLSNFPEIKVGISLIRGVKVVKTNQDLEKLKTDVTQKLREQFKGIELGKHPRVAAYRRIYRKFGVDPGSNRPSAESLLRRVLEHTKGIYNINTLVDTYNIASAELQLPMAAYDLDKLILPVQLCFSKAGEKHQAIGQTTIEKVKEGALVYADQRTIICRDFNYRDAELTKITLNTKDVIIFVDGCEEVSRNDMKEAIEYVSTRIVQFCGGLIDCINVYP